MTRFEGRVVMVTGAARGIGFASVQRFASEGGTVIATDIDEVALGEARVALESQGYNVETHCHDVTDPVAWQRVMEMVIARHGKLDVLVNNAGMAEFTNTQQTTLAQLCKVMAVNLEGVMLGMQQGIEAMKDTGGAIVNVASIAANMGEPLLAAYSATKGGVSMLTKVAAVDCARQGNGIRINSIHPGYTDTKLVRDALAGLGDTGAAQMTERVMNRVPAGRLAQPAEIASALVFLASDDASFMMGSELVVDGGYTAA